MSKDLRNKLAGEFYDTLRENGWYPSRNACDDIVKQSWDAKKNLRQLLSKHPHWSEQDQAIILTITQSLSGEKGVEGAYKDFWCLDEVASCGPTAGMALAEACLWSLDGKVTQEALLSLQKASIAAVAGQKLSRVITQWAKTRGIGKSKEYSSASQKLFDALAKKSVERKAVLSINPVDILLMSNGNSWDSCHSIVAGEEHEHRAGPMSYILDETSMIFFTVSPDCDNIHQQGKITRQMFHYDNGLLIQSCLYPDCTKRNWIDQYRNIVQTAIAKCLGVRSRWKFDRRQQNVAAATCTVADSVHYADYNPPSGAHNNCTKSCLVSLRDALSYADSCVNIGSPGMCIECGGVIHETDRLACCRDSRCDYCDSWLSPGDTVYHIEDCVFCEDCVLRCHGCRKVYPPDASFRFAVMSDGTTGKFCESCCSSVCENCDQCGFCNTAE